ncbi:hypothetical protein J2Y38_000514 [Flavobacterium sp. 2755]|uniref:hypothetical protein n=1 Tax=Flavobacterium sp. 2755 TaxID=2817765 RepID=UPI00285C8A57|nr:hypothetical protein [Flavobacterium sp. 2755]MDR6760335.1 hypothetical protein [Flavobacterium sp. 2755]
MKFDKNKDEIKNFKILIKEIKSKASPYSKILLEALESTNTSDEFRNALKQKINEYIEHKIMK